MSTSETAAEHGGGLPVIHLSQLLRAPVLARSGEAVGRVEDVIVRLRGNDEYPLVTGIVAGVGGRRRVHRQQIHRRVRFRTELCWPRTRLTFAVLNAATVRCCCAPTCWAPADRCGRRGAGARL